MTRSEFARVRSRVLACCLGICLLAFGIGDHAGAASVEWSFEVIDVTTVDRHQHLIRLRPAPAGEHFPRSCETFIIHAYYDLEGWSSAGKRLALRSAHERSVQLLLQAQVMKKIVRIRSVGRGFGAIPEAPRCEVRSRALTVAPDRGGTPVIFSMHEDPRGGR